MTNARSSSDPAPITHAQAGGAADSTATPVTGVAAGGLGTAANLEETQVLRTADIDAFEGAELDAAADAAHAGDAAGEAPVPASAAEPVAASVAAAPAEPIVVPPTAVPPAPVERVPRPRVRSSSQPARGLAGVLAVALVVLAGVAILATRGDGAAGAGSLLSPTGSITPVETAAPDREAGREGDGDKGKKCNGKGRGNSCEGGGGDDD